MDLSNSNSDLTRALTNLVFSEDIKSIKEICRVWQFECLIEKKLMNHSDMMCIVYNYLYMEFERDPSQFLVNEAKFKVNFVDMEEIVNGQTRKI